MHKILNGTDKILEIYNNYQLSPKTQKLVQEFTQSKSRYVFGRTRYAQLICKKIKIDFVIDDFAPEGALFEDAKVIKLKDVPKESIVVNSIMDGACVDIHNKIINSNRNFVISYADLFYSFPNQFEIPSVIIDTRENFSKNQMEYQKTFDNLNDETSKKVFHDVLCFRLTGQYSFLSLYNFRLKEQYFEDFLNIQEGEVFVDCGGFYGDTSEEFIKRCPEFNKIYFFEPNKENYEKALKRLNNNEKIQFIKKGVSDKTDILNMSLNGDTSCITECEGLKIKVVKIDEAINDKITFIKMDLEGWELNALKGAENHIRINKPKLAISVYHRPQDFYTIYEYVKSINPGYRVYLRHYTQGLSETVMYFMP